LNSLNKKNKNKTQTSAGTKACPTKEQYSSLVGSASVPTGRSIFHPDDAPQQAGHEGLLKRK
jgi:hypothetical protein